MVFDNTDLIIGGVISLGALAFAVTALVRTRKNKKEREEAKKKYEAELGAMPPLTPEQIKEIKDDLNGGSLTGRQTATRDIGNYGPNSRRANIAPAKSVPKSSDNWAQTRMAQDAANRKANQLREEDEREQRRRRDDYDQTASVGFMSPSKPYYRQNDIPESSPSRCDDTSSHSHRSSHSSCSSSSWGGDSGSSSSSSYDSGSSCSSSSSCD